MINKEKYVKTAAILILLALLTVVNPYFHNLVADVFSKEQYNIQSLWSLYLDKTSKVEGLAGESIVIRNDDELKAVKPGNEELWSLGLSDSDKVLIVRDNQLCYYNSHNKQLTSIDDMGNKNWSLGFNNLVDIKPFEQNLIGVYSKDKDNTAFIEIIDINGAVAGSVEFQDGVLIDYDIDYQSSKIVVSIMTVKNDQIINTVFLAGFSGEIYWRDVSEDKIITKSFIYQDQISTFDGETIITKDYQGEILWSLAVEADEVGFSQDGQFLYAYDSPQNKSTILRNKKPMTITLVDIKGQRLSQITPANQNLKIKSLEDYVINISKRKIYIYSREGTEAFNHYANRDIVDVYISEDDNIIVVYRNEIACYRLSKN